MNYAGASPPVRRPEGRGAPSLRVSVETQDSSKYNHNSGERLSPDLFAPIPEVRASSDLPRKETFAKLRNCLGIALLIPESRNPYARIGPNRAR